MRRIRSRSLLAGYILLAFSAGILAGMIFSGYFGVNKIYCTREVAETAEQKAIRIYTEKLPGWESELLFLGTSTPEITVERGMLWQEDNSLYIPFDVEGPSGKLDRLAQIDCRSGEIFWHLAD